jgi:hypothetical protein
MCRIEMKSCHQRVLLTQISRTEESEQYAAAAKEAAGQVASIVAGSAAVDRGALAAHQSRWLRPPDFCQLAPLSLQVVLLSQMLRGRWLRSPGRW